MEGVEDEECEEEAEHARDPEKNPHQLTLVLPGSAECIADNVLGPCKDPKSI